MHRRRLDQTAFGFACVKTCVAHVPDIVIEYMRIPQEVGPGGRDRQEFQELGVGGGGQSAAARC